MAQFCRVNIPLNISEILIGCRYVLYIILFNRTLNNTIPVVQNIAQVTGGAFPDRARLRSYNLQVVTGHSSLHPDASLGNFGPKIGLHHDTCVSNGAKSWIFTYLDKFGAPKKSEPWYYPDKIWLPLSGHKWLTAIRVPHLYLGVLASANLPQVTLPPCFHLILLTAKH